MAEDQPVADDLKQHDQVSRGERLLLTSSASLDRTQYPVDDKYDPGELDQDAKYFFLRHAIA
jgi:hypothetical protein